MRIKERDISLFKQGVLTSLSSHEVKPPSKSVAVPNDGKQIVAQVDWGKINADRTNTGSEGEEWVCSILREELTAHGRTDLADRVEHVSQTRGDGLGYDILSFDERGAEKFIEVKTTTSPRSDCPFYVTVNELTASKKHSASFWLYRVFGWSGSMGQYWRIQGSLEQQFRLEPVNFLAHR